MSMFNTLPSLEGLRYFEAAARFLNFTRAAEDLYLTQSAVSQKIQALEEQLGYPLFYRLPRGLRLTANGECLYASVRQALGILRDTLHQIGDESLDGALKLRTMPSFATKWLLPRLASFTELYPNIELQIDAELALPNFNNDEIDIAVTPIWTDNPRLHQVFLFDDLVYPVASPYLLQRIKLDSYAELASTQLLHDSMPQDAYSTYWDGFLARLGQFDLGLKGGSSYSRADLVIQAACAGQGVALGRHSLCEKDLEMGLLVRPFKDVLQDGKIWLTCPQEYSDRPRIQAFTSWLQQEVSLHLKQRDALLQGARIHKLR